MKNTVYKSQDGKSQVWSDEVTHVCVAPNIYPFLQFFLLMDDNTVFHHTYYFFNDTIPQSIVNQLPCSVFKYINRSIKDKILKRINKIRLRFFINRIYPFMKSAEIFAYDIPYLSLCIGKRPYNLLADAPNWITLLCQEHSQEHLRIMRHANSLVGKIERWFFGDLYIHYHGQNPQCKAIYLTEENTALVLQGKEVHIDSMSSLWGRASDTKKRYIMNLFDIKKEDVAFISSKPIVFFSQPLMKDCRMSEEEYRSVLIRIFQNYPLDGMIIKTHPRDTFDYNKYFPEIYIFSKPISSQILYLVGLRPERVVTICSTAIEAFPETIECDYYGIHVHPKIEAFFDEHYKPNRKVNYK